MEIDLYHPETFREGIIKLSAEDKNKIRNKMSNIKEDNDIILCWIYEFVVGNQRALRRIEKQLRTRGRKGNFKAYLPVEFKQNYEAVWDFVHELRTAAIISTSATWDDIVSWLVGSGAGTYRNSRKAEQPADRPLPGKKC